MVITETATFTLSVAGLTGLVAVITAWVTLRMTVQQQAKDHTKLAERIQAELKALAERMTAELKMAHDRIDKLEGRIGSLERWRERTKGAEAYARRREDTNPMLLAAPGGASREAR